MAREILKADFTDDLSRSEEMRAFAFAKAGFTKKDVKPEIYVNPTGYVTEEIYKKGDITIRFLTYDPSAEGTEEITPLFQYHIFRGEMDEEEIRYRAKRVRKGDLPALNAAKTTPPAETRAEIPEAPPEKKEQVKQDPPPASLSFDPYDEKDLGEEKHVEEGEEEQELYDDGDQGSLFGDPAPEEDVLDGQVSLEL